MPVILRDLQASYTNKLPKSYLKATYELPHEGVAVVACCCCCGGVMLLLWQARADLNGEIGIALRFDEKSRRWLVRRARFDNRLIIELVIDLIIIDSIIVDLIIIEGSSGVPDLIKPKLLLNNF